MSVNRLRLVLLLAGALVLAPLTACGGASSTEEGPATSEETVQEETAQEEGTDQIANPFVDCSSAYEMAQIAGFDVTFPESVPGYAKRQYQAVKGELAQCFYTNGDDADMVLIRKGTGEEDISGDYNEYGTVNEVTVGNVVVTERGDDGLVYVAIWTRDGYSFAIDADTGLEAAVVEQLVPATM